MANSIGIYAHFMNGRWNQLCVGGIIVRRSLIEMDLICVIGGLSGAPTWLFSCIWGEFLAWLLLVVLNFRIVVVFSFSVVVGVGFMWLSTSYWFFAVVLLFSFGHGLV